MAKNDIRKAVPLPAALESRTFDLQGTALDYLPNHIHQAVVTIKSAWDLLPEPKFNTSCSDTILSDYIYILNFALKHEEASLLLGQWIADIEGSGYKIYVVTPYLLMGETLLFLEKPAAAKAYFQKALELGTRRDFSDKPVLYLDIATGKITDEEVITHEFEALDLLEVWAKKEADTAAVGELSDTVLEKIDEICEAGSELFDEDEYKQAIKTWGKAFDLIPEPQNSYSQSLWLHSSIGDAYFLLGDFKKAAAHFFEAKSNIAENGYTNAFVMLRLGESCFEINDIENAKEFLVRAYMLEGKDLFESEDEKYFNFLRESVKL